jgi:sulfoxide reductase heme-binding subunit YedZ
MTKANVRAAKVAVFALCLVPALMLVWRTQQGTLGVNPIETITHATGDWTLRLLLVTLAVTPLRRLTGWNRLIGFRRMLGLFAFFYATLHLLTYAWLDQALAWPSILHDIPKRPFITAGFGAFVLLVPLALTSTAGAIRRLGGAWWRRLHSLIYVAALLGVVHFWWLVKADISRPARYACALALLLLPRVWVAVRKRLAVSVPGRRPQLENAKG